MKARAEKQIAYKCLKLYTNIFLLELDAMETISFRPSKKVSAEFEHALHSEHAAKSDLARELFELGLKSWRQKKALTEFTQGKASFLSAANEAGVTAYEFLELVKTAKISFIHITQGQIQEELELARS